MKNPAFYFVSYARAYIACLSLLGFAHVAYAINSVIVDNQDSVVSIFGSWHSVDSIDPNDGDGNLWTSAGDWTEKVRYPFTVPETGKYKGDLIKESGCN